MSRIILHKTKSRDNSSTLQKTSKQEVSKFKELPSHIVENIVRYNFRDRHEISLACKAFYEATYKIYEDSYLLKIDADDIFNENSEKLKLLSKPMKDCRPRIFRTLEINFDRSDENADEQKISKHFWNFIDRQSENITKILIKGQIEVENLTKIFTCASKIEDLTLQDLFILPQDFDVVDFQHLGSLSKLNVDKCYDFDFKKFKLKANVLKNFNIITTRCKFTLEDDLKEFLAEQRDLKTFKIDSNLSRNLTFMKNYQEICNLEQFSFAGLNRIVNLSHPVIEQFVVQQSNLKILELDNNIWDSIFIKIVENLKNLEHFSVSFTNLLAENFVKIENLKNLKTLKLVDTNLNLIFTSIFNISVEKLMLDSCTITGIRATVNFTKSFPNVKILDVKPCITLRTHFIFEEMFENMPNLEDVKFQNIEGWITPSFKIRSSSMVNQNLKSLVVNFPVIYKWAFFKNFPNLTNLDIFIDNSERGSMKMEIQKIFSDLKYLQKICITFVSIYQVDFDILKLISFNPNLKIIQLTNIFMESSAIIRNIKEYKRFFDIVEISCDPGKIGLTILLAKNENNLLENRENFEKFLKIFCSENDKFYRVNLLNLYKKGLKYQNIGEVVSSDDF